MTKKDYEGIVTSVAVPRYDLPGGKPCFVFSIPKPTYAPPGIPENVPVFYVLLEMPYAELIMRLVLTAYKLVVPIQVGLISGKKMQVAWVQLPKSRVENRSMTAAT